MRALAQNGAKVILTSRSLAAGNKVVESLQRSPIKVGEPYVMQCKSATHFVDWCVSSQACVEQFSMHADILQGSLELQQLDLADLGSIDALAEQLANEAKLDILILNAGVGNCPQQFTKDGFELQVGTNHFGHFHLVSKLLNKLQNQVSIYLHLVCLPVL